MDRFEFVLEGVLEIRLDRTVVDCVVIVVIVDHLVNYVVVRIVDHLVNYVVVRIVDHLVNYVVVRNLVRLLRGLCGRLGWCIAGRLQGDL
ncbi:MAG: hypothetical protein VX243_03075, partial [Actinomycetota bacterium]|nr:hypothetical protein [Actinomycetota bacterium]